MKKEKVIEFFKELLSYIFVTVVLLLIAKKCGWTDVAVRDNVIGLTVGWMIWKVILLLFHRKKK